MRTYFCFNLPHQTTLCHDIALTLRKKYEHSDFGGYYVEKGGTHGTFLKSQNDILYAPLHRLEDILSEIYSNNVSSNDVSQWEKVLGFPLIQLIVADRNFGQAFNPGHIKQKAYEDSIGWESTINITVGFLNFFVKRLEAFHPDFVFLPAMASLHALSLFHVSKHLNIPCIRISPTPLPNRIMLATEPRFEPQFWQRELQRTVELSALPSEDLTLYLEHFRDNRPFPLLWGREKQLLVKEGILHDGKLHLHKKHLKTFLLALKNKLRQRTPQHWCQKEPLSDWFCQFWREIALAYPEVYHSDSIVDDENFVLYPLHFTPEASTMITSPEFTDQKHLVAMLSKSIPLWCKLYIKEHSSMLGRRKRSFYRSLRQYPNVTLINPWLDSHALIKKAKCTITIAGTCAWEAMMYLKPVIVVGRPPFPVAGTGITCSDIIKIPNILHEMCHNTFHSDMRSELIATLDRFNILGNARAIWQKIPPKEHTETVSSICVGIENIISGKYPRGDIPFPRRASTATTSLDNIAINKGTSDEKHNRQESH